MRYNVSVKFHKDFVNVEGDKIIVGVVSAPERGKANAEIIREIAEHFGVQKAAVRIISGVSSRKKVIEMAS
ncbi:MAG: DUF167 domain-containing protein [Candidatus Liptonbacteria bacterium]|nr:DUF167 domain-containing protein [Candidatus Liptonbacteria bacterium]